MAGHAYKSAVDELDNGVGRDLDAPFRATVLEPIGKLCSHYPVINEAIGKRSKKVSIRSIEWRGSKGGGTDLMVSFVNGMGLLDAGL